jgi:hypothetical protein
MPGSVASGTHCIRLSLYIILMHCIKIHLVYGTIKIIMDIPLNFIMADIILLNTLYWFPIFISFVMLTLFC